MPRPPATLTLDAETVEPTLSEEGQRTLLQEVFHKWITPEVQRRQAAGTVPKPFLFIMAQIVFDPVGPKTTVRLNEEVKAHAKIRLKSGLPLEIGKPVYAHEIAGVDFIDLVEDERDFGHITVARLGENYHVAWSARYNMNRVASLCRSAREFLDTARGAFEGARWGPFADNLFTAVELAAKAMMLPQPDDVLQSGRKHGIIASRFNRMRKEGDVEPAFSDLLNRLSEMRSAARYEAAPFVLDTGAARAMLETAERMWSQLEATRPRPTIPPEEPEHGPLV